MTRLHGFAVVAKTLQILMLIVVAWAGSIVVRNITEALIVVSGRDPAVVLDRHSSGKGEPLIARHAETDRPVTRATR